MTSRRLLARLSGSAAYKRVSSYSILSEKQIRSRGGNKGFNGLDCSPQSTMHLSCSPHHDDDNSDILNHKLFGKASVGFESYTNYSKFSTGFATRGLHEWRRGRPEGARYASSSSIGDGSDKMEYMNDVAQVLAEESFDIVNKTQAVNEVAAAAADSSYPVAVLQYFIEAVHIHCALPWWASIAATTLFIRSLTIPILISQLKATTRLTLMRPEMEEVTERLKQCTNPQMAVEERQRMKILFKKYDVTPFTPMKGILIQGPIFISFYLAITNMAANVPSFKEGGAFWFHDLSTPDSLYLLPALTALSFLATVELNMQEGLEGNPMAAKMKMFSRFFALITVPITMNFPKAIFCYWVTSNLFSLIYGAVIRKPGVKKALGIPKIPVPREPAETLVRSTTPIQKGPPSSSLVHQRLRALERTFKAKRHGKKR